MQCRPTPPALVSEIAASVPAPPAFKTAVADPTSFAEVYHAAEIAPPAHGYTIEKVSAMLQSEHLRGLSAEVRRSWILVALEASEPNRGRDSGCGAARSRARCL